MPTETLPTEFAHIVRTPGVLAGEPRIDGHRIRVRDIAAARDVGGHSAEQIADSVYPHLTLGQIYAALAYYEDHRDEMQALEHREEEFADRFARENPDLVTDHRGKADRRP